MKHLFSYLFILILYLFIFSVVVSANETYFTEEFDNNYLDEKWDKYDNDGLINFDTGYITLSGSNGQNFPYVRSAVDPFPSSGDFVLKFRVQFPFITAWGVGFLAGTSAPPNGIPVTDSIPSRIFTYHADTSQPTFWFRFFQENIFNSIAIRDLFFHEITMQYSPGEYKYFFDNNLIATRYNSIRPHAIFFGSPHNQKSLNENTEWTSIKLDYIKVECVPSCPLISPTPTNTPTPTPTATPTFTPTPTPSPISTPTPINNFPIILIPGHGGSWSLTGMLPPAQIVPWGKMPYFYDQVYGPLISALNEKGFTKENHNFYEFFYDWRQITDNSSAELDNFIQNKVLSGKPDGTKVNIIAHSYGGLVARNYLQKYKSQHNNAQPPVNKIITAGTPHEGVVQTYTAWEGGEITDNDVLKRFAFEALLHFYENIYSTKKEALQKIAPSTLDLFPIYNFLKTEKGQIIQSEKMNVQNSWLKSLKNNLNEKVSLKSYLNIFRGNGNNTMEYLKVKEPSWQEKSLGLWLDGIPLQSNSIEETTEGDGTVLTKSASIAGVETVEKTLDHGGLVNSLEGIKEIFKMLSLDQSLADIVNKPKAESMLSFMVHSPACLKITDADNKQIGCHTNSSSLIPNADTDADRKTILIINPQSSIYQVEVVGTGTGNYDLTYGQIAENKTVLNDFSGKVATGSSETYLFNKSEGNFILDDPQGTRSLLSSKNKLLQLKEEIAGKPYPANKKTKMIKEINKEVASLTRIINLLNLKLNKKASLELEKTILSLVFLSREFNFRNLGNQKDNLYFRKSLYGVIFDLRDVFVKIAVNIPRKNRDNHLFAAKLLLKIFENSLKIKIRGENLVENTELYLKIKDMLNSTEMNNYGNNFNKAYIDSVISREFIFNNLSSF